MKKFPSQFVDPFAPVQSRVGHRLGWMRVDLGLTQEMLSSLSGVTQADISRYENHRSLPSIATAKKLARALKCDFRVLVPF